MENISMLKSPITEKHNTKLIKSIATQKIIQSYQKTFGLDVSYFFEGKPEIKVFECLDTGYKFYYPLNVDGDGKFYEHLQEYEWYYMPWKWEHQQTTKLVKSNMKVLEVGCAKGDFLVKIQQDYQLEVTGLELNQLAGEDARRKGLNIVNETIQEYADKHIEKYDLVCSFQVLEHIANVKSFLEAQIKCLKKGGKLIIGVPNNDSFLGLDNWNILNFPPHHMGLWNEKAFRNLEKIFDIKVESIFFEPLQDYHYQYFHSVINKSLEKLHVERVAKYGFLGRVLNRMKKNHDRKLLYKNRPSLESFTILVVFEKI